MIINTVINDISEDVEWHTLGCSGLVMTSFVNEESNADEFKKEVNEMFKALMKRLGA